MPARCFPNSRSAGPETTDALDRAPSDSRFSRISATAALIFSRKMAREAPRLKASIPTVSAASSALLLADQSGAVVSPHVLAAPFAVNGQTAVTLQLTVQ